MKDSFFIRPILFFVVVLLVAVFLPKLVCGGSPIAFQVIVSDSSFLVDSIGTCGQFDTLFPDTIMLDSVVAYEKFADSTKTLFNFGPVLVNSELTFFWQYPRSGEHVICVAGYWQGFRGCENCLVFPSWVSPPKIEIKQ